MAVLGPEDQERSITTEQQLLMWENAAASSQKTTVPLGFILKRLARDAA